MYLKKLTVAGFKSFADPVEFHFHNGTTAIVGPNGCGKSNVVDAFRWVLGERSAKELRGNEMMDVIFKGTSRRDPLSRAEVSLLFDNEDGTLPIEFAEVEISRRLFRSGESEYLINGQKCRLKDLLALFADTGIGTEGYSVMEQGNLDAFLNSNPQERRKIFEEAAGVSRFKKQKDQALRRLERAQRDLERSQDRLGEADTRIRSLKIQATKAQRFVEDRDRLTRVRAVLSSEEIGALREERERLTFDLFCTQVQRSLLAKLDDGTEKRREEVRAAAEDAGNALTGLRGHEMELRVELEGIGQRLEGFAERRREIGDAGRRRGEQETELRLSEENYSEQRERIRAQVREAIASLRTSREESRTAEGRHRELETRRRSLEEEVHTAKEDALSRVYRETQLSNDRTALESERRSIESMRTRREIEAKEFADHLTTLTSVGVKVRGEREVAVDSARIARAEATILEDEIASRTGLLDDNRRELATLRGEFEEAQARLRFLRDLEERREGIGEGARRLLTSKTPLGRDVIGLLASGLEVEPELARAVDAALGVDGETVVLSGELPVDDRLRAIAREVDGREVTIVQVEGLTTLPSIVGSLPEGCSWLSEHVGLEPRHSASIGALLEGVLLCSSLEIAEFAARTVPDCRRCVLKNGTVIESWGAVHLPAREGRGLVSRRIEIRGLEGRIESLGDELDRAREHGNTLEETIQARWVEIRRRQESAQRHELDVEHAERVLRENEEERERIAERRDVVGAELAELDAQDVELAVELVGKVAELEDVQGQRAKLEASVRVLEAERGPLEEELSEVESACSRLRVETTQTEERLVASRREQMRVQSELEERRSRRLRLVEEGTHDQERLERLASEEERDSSRRAELAEQLGSLAERVTKAEEETHAAKAALKDAEHLLTRLRREGDVLREHREEKLLGDNERRVKIDGIREKIAEELEVDVSELPVEEWRGALAEELGEENLIVRLRSEQEDISKRLRKNANVNLQAVEELGGEEERRDHLGSQIADLEESSATLLETIEALNEKSRELFLATFEEVRKNFQEIFRTVFNGGKADLMLEEGVDPLEAGVDVMARPPGKRINSLRALSGGEKALTAVSVMFALFRTKPSPFCILDEVDAPLDESNIRRFVRVLQQFSKESQFLIITHSRVTMGEAERLYGVTMEEEGVSRKVAVRIEKDENEEAAADGSIHADSLLPAPRLGSDDHLPEDFDPDEASISEASEESDAEGEGESVEAEPAVEAVKARADGLGETRGATRAVGRILPHSESEDPTFTEEAIFEEEGVFPDRQRESADSEESSIASRESEADADAELDLLESEDPRESEPAATPHD